MKENVLGHLGEEIIFNHFVDQYDISFNKDKYGFWDLAVWSKLHYPDYIQVKTITPFIKYNSFIINGGKTGETLHNLMRCTSLYIIAIPTSGHKTDGHILHVDISDIKYSMFKLLPENRFSTEKSLFIPRDWECLKIVKPLSETERKLVLENSISYFNSVK